MGNEDSTFCRAPGGQNRGAFTLLFLLIILIYGNSIHNDWHFDDKGGILESTQIKLESLSCQSLYRTLFLPALKNGETQYRLYRPVSNLSLSLNWYFGKDRTTGYHLVNIAIHLLASFFLYLSIGCLFQTPKLKQSRMADKAQFIALLSTVLWAVNPIQTQAVTYIIQRMASLAAMFSILGIFLFLKGRLTAGLWKRAGYFTGCGIAFLLAVGSKENTVIWPMNLVLIEVAFFRNLQSVKTRRFLWLSFTIAVLIVLAAVALFLEGRLVDGVLAFYKSRPFSPYERILTEGRILIYYLSLIYYPVPTRLSIEHGLEISSSMIHPWQTLPSIFLVIGLICFGLYLLKKKPLIGFCLLFFFLNHSVESTILGIELIFEHRNYLPSFFLFIPVAVGICLLLERYKRKDKTVYHMIVLFTVVLVIGFGWGTHLRNQVWRTEETLWLDAMEKAPGQDRAPHNLALYYEEKGYLDRALMLNELALKAKSIHHSVYRDITLSNMASIYYRMGRFEKGMDTALKALTINPNNIFARRNLFFSLGKLNQWKEASAQADILLKENVYRSVHQYLKGLALIHLEDNQKAMQHLGASLAITPDYRDALLPMGIALSRTGRYDRAQKVLKRAVELSGGHILTVMGLMENYLRAGDKIGVQKATVLLLNAYSATSIATALSELAQGHSLVPISWRMLIPVIAQAFDIQARDIHTLKTLNEDR